ncbi:MAG TPA: tyrosine--tRNA ligase [Chlamydiales bacterium]|nr:tyrosine--tRNA ligase [Chlamydiales bacterium]
MRVKASAPVKNVIDMLMERGFVDQMTSPLLTERAAKPLKLYVGFDPTADSLHLGNLIGIMALAWFQRFGHTPYAVIGGATGRIGDPSGKSMERPFLDEKELARNVFSLTCFLQKILQFPHGSQPVIVNNNDWLGKMSLIDFLRDTGKHFRIGPMLQKESVKARLQSEEGMSFTEFSYQLLQGYDFHYLNHHFGVELQLGGSDQWGNITAGIEFNRKLKEKPIYGLTWPLLVQSDGKKFGKSEKGAVWLTAEKLSPYQFYQYLFKILDADVIRLMKMLTFMDLEEIRSIQESMSQADYVPNSAQKRLAEEVTRFVHGEEGLKAALRVTAGIQPGTEARLSSAMLQEIAADMPRTQLAVDEIVGKKFVDLSVRIGLVASKGEGVRLIKNGGAYLNNERIEDVSFSIEFPHLIDGRYLVMSAGKKKKMLIETL